MEEAFLASIAAVVLEKLAPLIANGVSSALSVNSELRKLRDSVTRIQAVLSDAERQQHQNEHLRLCMWKLREIFYDAEDVIDCFKCEDLRRQVSRNPDRRFRDRWSAKRVHCSFSIRMGLKIEGINKRLSKLETEWDSFGLRECSDDRRHDFHRDTHSFVNPWDLIGRCEEKRKILDLLRKPGNSVISIVGMGGLGKTTVVQSVYNDPQVTRLFPKRIWVCVSKEFDRPRLLKLMIQSINPEERCDLSALDALHNCLRRLLQDKRFLLVLDDVWNDNLHRWAEFKGILSSMGGWFESKIIVTTRSSTVASIMSSIDPLELKDLPYEDCLELFKKWAFDDDDDVQRHPNFMRIGEDIVKRCKGVPLAVRTFGILLHRKTDESDWISVRDGETWRLEQSGQGILPVLKLSYDHLPPRLQRCLALLSLYKKDEIFRSHEVIQLWMANGLLEDPNDNEEWEDVGDRYLTELLSSCLVQKEKDYENYFVFRMPDLVHDLALKMSQKDCKMVSCQTTIDEAVRHLSFSDDKLKVVPEDLKKLKKVRTMIIQEVSKESKTIDKSLIDLCVSKFEKLRVLRLRSRSSLTALHEDIGKLKHLRDLDLAGCHGIRELPSSFYKLRCLQKLRMSGIPLKQLSESMTCLIELRYLEITVKAKHLTEIREGSWPCLQYLGLIDCDNLQCLPEGLKHLTSLRRLDLLGCSNLVSLPRTMKFLTKLESLSISSCKRINLQMEPGEEDDNLQLNLKTLSLWDLGALRDLPRLLLERSSSTLRRIRIENCYNFEVLPVWLEKLSSLHELEILDCPKMPTLPEGLDWTGLIRHLPFIYG